MTWVIGGLIGWSFLALALAVVIGRGIRLADRRASVEGEFAVQSTSAIAPARTRRRAIPVPPAGIALIAVAVALETTGFVVRLSDATGPSAQLLDMDAPFSMPRMFVTTLFAVAALAALAAGTRIPGRRTWWLAVGLVAAGIAGVKAGSTVHSDALGVVSGALGSAAALWLSTLVATVVVGALWFLSRTERRDRRRILSVLAVYAAASVGLSAVSGLVGAQWSAAATYVEETGEALAGVAFLLAVLAGVAPRLVLPAAWVLRREADAHTLEVPEYLPARVPGGGIGRS